MTKTWKGRKALGTGHTSKKPLEKMTEEANLTLLADLICSHDIYCNVKITLDKAHCSKEYAKNCQTNKFYDRYGEKGNQLGVGS